MSEQSDSGERSAETLLGVPAPRIDDVAESAARKPVFVRSGTSVADNEGEPPPVPRMALPSRPPAADSPHSEMPPALTASLNPTAGGIAQLARRHPGLWMAGVPLVLASLVVGAIVATSAPTKPTAATTAAVVQPPSAGATGVAATALGAPKAPRKSDAAPLESKPLGSLSASELLELSQARSEQQREAARALRKRIEDNPALLADKPVQRELLALAGNAETARDALAAMSVSNAIGADLLYEVWAGTAAKTETTELARALVYSSDVRSKATPALAIALELRQAETCEQFQAALPKALKDGDRRSLPPLMKLGNRRGCGPKKSEDCFACVRGAPQEITATINAVKSRRPPTFVQP